MKKIISVALMLACIACCLLACHHDEAGITTTVNTRPTLPTSSSTVSTSFTTLPTGNTTTIPSSSSSRPTSTKPTVVPSTPTSCVPTMTTTVAGLTLPYQIPNTGLMLDQVAPYDGIYVEDGSNSEIQGVAMIMLRNFSKHDIEVATITLTYGQFTREFVVTCLPAGMSAVVQEKNRNPMASGILTECTASIIESNREVLLTRHELAVTENKDNSITIENISTKDFPSIRLFYKYFMSDMQVLVGGITFTVNVTDLKAGQSVTVKPSHYLAGASEIVMVQTYEGTT